MKALYPRKASSSLLTVRGLLGGRLLDRRSLLLLLSGLGGLGSLPALGGGGGLSLLGNGGDLGLRLGLALRSSLGSGGGGLSGGGGHLLALDRLSLSLSSSGGGGLALGTSLRSGGSGSGGGGGLGDGLVGVAAKVVVVAHRGELVALLLLLGNQPRRGGGRLLARARLVDLRAVHPRPGDHLERAVGVAEGLGVHVGGREEAALEQARVHHVVVHRLGHDRGDLKKGSRSKKAKSDLDLTRLVKVCVVRSCCKHASERASDISFDRG